MKFHNLLAPLVALSSAPLASGAAIVIDDFNSAQLVSTLVTGSPVSSVAAAPSAAAAGGVRQITATKTSGLAGRGISAATGGGFFSHSTDFSVIGVSQLFYGGPTTTAGSRDYNGIPGGLDLIGTSDPTLASFYFNDLLGVGPGVQIDITLYPYDSGAGVVTTAPTDYLSTSFFAPVGNTPEFITDPVSEWTVTGSGVNLSSIGSILVRVSSSTPDADFAFGKLEFQEIPEPGMAWVGLAACGVFFLRRRSS